MKELVGTRAQVLPSDTVNLQVGGHTLAGFKRVESWEGMDKFQKGLDYVILNTATENKEGLEIIKVSPRLSKQLATPPKDEAPAEQANAAAAGGGQ